LQAALVDDLLGLLGSARGDVGQRPGGFQLDVREEGKLKVGDQVRQQRAVQDRLDWRFFWRFILEIGRYRRGL